MRVLKSYAGPAGLVILLSGAGIMLFEPGQALLAYALMGGGLLLVAAAVIMNFEDLADLSRGRAVRHGANAVFYTLLVLMIVAAVNFLSSRHHRRFDVTEQGINTLSPQTVQILENLKEGVEVVAFYSEMNDQKRQFEDLAAEYRYHTDKLNVRLVDPLKAPGEARRLEIDQDGTIVVLASTGESRTNSVGEEDLTNAILKATRTVKKSVCFTTGHGEASSSDSQIQGLALAADALKKENFETREVLLLQTAEVPADCKVVVVAGPSTPLLPAEAESLARYLGGGGRLLVLKRDPKAGTGLDGLLSDHGLKVNSDVVVDRLSRAIVGDEFVPVVTQYKTHASMKALSDRRLATFFPVASSVEKIDVKEGAVSSEIVAETGPDAWGETGDVVGFEASSDHAGPVGLIGAASGPAGAPRKEAASAAAEGEEGSSLDEKSASDAERRLMLIGDSDFATNAYLHLSGNSDLFLNSVAWLASESDLISIRAKKNMPQPVTLTASGQNLLTFMTYVLPLAAVVTGAGVWMRRKRL